VVSINEDANRRYQEIFNTLQNQERNYSNPGLYWTTLLLVLVFALMGLYFWLNRKEDVKDIATLENFEIFIDQYLKRLDIINNKRLIANDQKTIQVEAEEDEPEGPNSKA